MCVHFFNFDHLRITLQSSDLICVTKFRAPSDVALCGACRPWIFFINGVLYDAIIPPRALDRRLHEDWARDARKGPRVLTSLRVHFEPMG